MLVVGGYRQSEAAIRVDVSWAGVLAESEGSGINDGSAIFGMNADDCGEHRKCGFVDFAAANGGLESIVESVVAWPDFGDSGEVIYGACRGC